MVKWLLGGHELSSKTMTMEIAKWNVGIDVGVDQVWPVLLVEHPVHQGPAIYQFKDDPF